MDTATKIGLAALLLATIGALDFLVIRAVSRRWGGHSQGLNRRLQAIAARRSTPNDHLFKEEHNPTGGLATWLAARMPGLEGVQKLLIRAGSVQTASHVLNLTLGAATVLGLVSYFASHSFLLATAAAMLSIGVPLLRLKGLAAKRRRMFTDQLPDALDFMSRALRAGHSLSIAIGMVADELPDPIGHEFRLVFDEVNFGISFQDALIKMPQRIDSSDLGFFVVAVLIQRETGGNLSDLLHGLAGTVRERLKLQGRVRVLSSEGKYSGVMLGALPFLMAAALSAINPKYMDVLWHTPKGNHLVYGGLFAMAIGFAWMWKITQIRV
jgi:tight adherence protein B